MHSFLEEASDMQIAERGEQFRQQIGSLELLASNHNGIVKSMTSLETPLLEPKLAEVMTTVQQRLMASLSPPSAVFCQHYTKSLQNF